MNDMPFIIVQAGGKGTRLQKLTYNKPKALVPVNNLPMLFHLFHKFPKSRFLIIGDYKYEVLEKYLAVYAEVEYQLIDARGKTGTCAGVGDALHYIPDETPFMMIWSDLILSADYKTPVLGQDYIGISKDFKCRWSYINGQLSEMPSCEYGVAGHFIFTDKSKLKDVPEEGEFVRWLKETSIKFCELPLYKTKEYGVLSEYQKEPLSKCRPFNRITIDGDRVTKEGIDRQGRELASRENVWYQKVKEHEFDNIPIIYSTNPIVMEKIAGLNVYEYDLTHEQKKAVLGQLIECIKEIHLLDGCPLCEESFREAYIGKTFARLEKVKKLIPFAEQEYIVINNKKCKNVFFCKEELQKKVMQYKPTEFRLLHGDCTFSNILLKNGQVPVMIDPRGYFGFTELYGDPAYDWAKLYYSIVGNYDQFNLKRFDLKIEENEVWLEIVSNHWEDMENEFFELLDGDVEIQQIKLLHAIIWLSLTTYAWDDYDSICGAYYNGILLLNEIL